MGASTTLVPASATMAYPYVYELQANLCIIHTPIFANELSGVIQDIKTKIGHTDVNFLLGVIGQGITEQHIVTMHILPGDEAKCIVYDSKYSDFLNYLLEFLI